MRVEAAAPALPQTLCDSQPCWRGLVPEAGAPLTLFARPIAVAEAPSPEPLFGDELRLPLASLFAAGGTGARSYRASSSDESVATARIAGGELVVQAAYGAEGRARIEVAATDAFGQSATMAFDVAVEFYWPPRPHAGWRGATRLD